MLVVPFNGYSKRRYAAAGSAHNCVCQLDVFTAFGICSVIVNEGTPNDAELWKVGVCRWILVNDK
jgi:hypothetical protein